ncbi:MAG TPA: choice-of-anchor D domain-containing protein [Myxococcales bacterium]|nr:choice-of-anchor D domain-containing protein [Myxococcales bacterium]
MRANAWTLLPLALGATTACCKKNGIQSQQGTLTIQDGQTDVTNRADDFGNVCPGQQGSKALSLTATSDADVSVSTISVSGDGFSATVPALPLSIPAGSSVALPVVFAPSADGPATGKLTVTSSDSTDPTVTVSLTGTGQTGAPDPVYGATCDYPSSSGTVTDHPFPCDVLLWDGVVVGSTATDALTISDTGCPPLSIQSVTISGGDAGASPFTLPGLPALPVAVPSGTPFTLNIGYSPTAAGSFDQATLTVTTNDPTGSIPAGGTPGVFVYTLTGTGLASDVQIDCSGCAGSPPSYDFGGVTQGITATEVFTVLNTGTLPVTLAAPTLANGVPFSIAAGWSAGTILGASGSGTDSQQCTVQFTSQGSGLFRDQLLVDYSSAQGNGTAAANLVAHSAGELCATPNPLVLPPAGYCGSASATLTLGNCGNANLTISGLGFADGGDPRNAFSATVAGGLALPQTIGADGGLSVLVTYQDDGDLTDPFATLVVQSTDPGAPDGGTLVSVQAQAQPVPRPGDSPAQLPDSGVGCNVTTAFAAAPGNDAPLYSYTWSLVGCPGGVTLASDGGTAWVTPTVDESGCNLCLQAWEQPTAGGFSCGFDAGSVGHCTPFPAVNNCP